MSTWSPSSSPPWVDLLNQSVGNVESAAWDIEEAVQKNRQELKSVVSDEVEQLVATQEELGETLDAGLTAIETELRATTSAVRDLQSDFNHKMGLLITEARVTNEHLAQLNEQIQSIHETLENPTTTKFREQYRLAQDQLVRGLLNEAVEAFREAIEYNPSDFFSHYHLGRLYLTGVNDTDNVVDLDEARHHFTQAARYAKGELKVLRDQREGTTRRAPSAGDPVKEAYRLVQKGKRLQAVVHFQREMDSDLNQARAAVKSIERGTYGKEGEGRSTGEPQHSMVDSLQSLAAESYFLASCACYAKIGEKKDESEEGELIQDATQLVRQALEFDPELTEAYYHRAKYAAFVDETDPIWENLDRAVERDRRYLLKAEADGAFSEYRDDLRSFQKNLREKQLEAAESQIEEARRVLNEAEEWKPSESSRLGEDNEFARDLLERAESGYERGTYFGARDAEQYAREVQELAETLEQNRRSDLLDLIAKYRKEALYFDEAGTAYELGEEITDKDNAATVYRALDEVREGAREAWEQAKNEVEEKIQEAERHLEMARRNRANLKVGSKVLPPDSLSEAKSVLSTFEDMSAWDEPSDTWNVSESLERAGCLTETAIEELNTLNHEFRHLRSEFSSLRGKGVMLGFVSFIIYGVIGFVCAFVAGLIIAPHADGIEAVVIFLSGILIGGVVGFHEGYKEFSKKIKPKKEDFIDDNVCIKK